MKRKIKLTLLIAVGVLLAAAAAWLLWGGARTDVFVSDFSVEGDVLTVGTGVGSSMGYVRSCRTETKGDGLYLTFCSTFGPNCSLGAKNRFDIELPDGCAQVFLRCSSYENETGFRLLLEKDEETGEWMRAVS